MKLDEAIEIKEAYLRGDEPDDPLELILADRLSIEAMKAWKTSRDYSSIHQVPLLPGETEP